VANSNVQVGRGGVIAQAEEVDWCCQIVARQGLQTRETLFEIFVVPFGDLTACCYGGGPGCGLSKLAMEDRIQEPSFRMGDVPGEFESTPAIWVRLVAALVVGDRIHDLSCYCLFGLELGQQEMKKTLGFVGLHG
jgi:hypothetical protein